MVVFSISDLGEPERNGKAVICHNNRPSLSPSLSHPLSLVFTNQITVLCLPSQQKCKGGREREREREKEREREREGEREREREVERGERLVLIITGEVAMVFVYTVIS